MKMTRPSFWISKVWWRIRFQVHQKPPSIIFRMNLTNFLWNPDAWPPFRISHFAFRNSNSESFSATPKIPSSKIFGINLRNSVENQETMAAILNPPFSVSKFWQQNRFQRPRQPPVVIRMNLEISCEIRIHSRHFECSILFFGIQTANHFQRPRNPQVRCLETIFEILF